MNDSEVTVMSSEGWQKGVFFKVDSGEGRDPHKKDLGQRFNPRLV